MHRKEIKSRPDGGFDVVSTSEYVTDAQIIQLRDFLRAERDRYVKALAEIDAGLPDLETACLEIERRGKRN